MRNLMISMVLCSGLLLAQGPMGRGMGQRGGMRGPGPMAQGTGQGQAGATALKTYLGLTDAQVEQMQTLRKQRAEAMQPEAAALRAKAQELRQLMQTSNPDPAKVGALTVELKQLREKATAARSSVDDQIKAVLTADQQAKLKDLEAAAKLGPAVRQAIGAGLIEAPQMEGLGAGPGPLAQGLRGRAGARARR